MTVLMVQLFLLFQNQSKDRGMPFKRILLYVWISLLLIVAIFVLLRDDVPNSEWITERDLAGKARLIEYKDAKVELSDAKQGIQEIQLMGKVYIEVPNQKELTYMIRTSEALIEVSSGIAVIDASIERTTEIIVAEGQVSLTPLKTSEGRRKRKVPVTSGEKAILSPYAKGIIKQNNRDVNFKAWADFKLSFQNEKIEQVILTLQEVYGVEIMLSSPNLSKCRFTGDFNQVQLEEIIEELSDSFGLTATQREDDGWELVGEGC